MCEHHDHRMRDAPAIERFVEWLLPKTSELVGVANLATRCGFAAGGRLRAAPTRCGGSRELTATNKVHPLSFAFAQQLPQRWSQGVLRTCGRLLAAPTSAVETGGWRVA